MSFTAKSARIVIVGAGISGLAAAVTLFQEDFKNISILEAKNRVGGRIHSITTENFTFEEGAQWLQEGLEVEELLKKFPSGERIQIHQNLRDLHCSFEDQVDVSEADRKTAISAEDQFYEIFDGADLVQTCNQKQSLLSYIETEWKHYVDNNPNLQKPIFESLFDNLSKTYCTYDGVSTLNDLAVQSGFEKIGDETITVDGGLSKIIQLFLNALPAHAIKFKHRVTKIDWQSDNALTPIRIFCDVDGESQEYEADHVIVTLPLGILKKHHKAIFHPSLNQEKIAAIDRLGFGITDKIILYYDTPVWKSHSEDLLFIWKKIDKNPVWWKTIITPHIIQDNANNKAYICIFLAGKEAIQVEKLDDNEVGKICSEILQKFLNLPEVPIPKFTYVTKWASDPYSCGSYSFVPAGGSNKDFDKLAKPLPINGKNSPPRLLFAGEATHSKFYSTIHGAYYSGVREAQRLINFTQKVH